MSNVIPNNFFYHSRTLIRRHLHQINHKKYNDMVTLVLLVGGWLYGFTFCISCGGEVVYIISFNTQCRFTLSCPLLALPSFTLPYKNHHCKNNSCTIEPGGLVIFEPEEPALVLATIFGLWFWLYPLVLTVEFIAEFTGACWPLLNVLIEDAFDTVEADRERSGLGTNEGGRGCSVLIAGWTYDIKIRRGNDGTVGGCGRRAGICIFTVVGGV